MPGSDRTGGGGGWWALTPNFGRTTCMCCSKVKNGGGGVSGTDFVGRVWLDSGRPLTPELPEWLQQAGLGWR